MVSFERLCTRGKEEISLWREKTDKVDGEEAGPNMETDGKTRRRGGCRDAPNEHG